MTVYKCDRCGRIVEDKSNLVKLHVDFYVWQDKDTYWKNTSRWSPFGQDAELCKCCRDQLLKTLNAFINPYIKQKEENYEQTKLDTGHGD